MYITESTYIYLYMYIFIKFYFYTLRKEEHFTVGDLDKK